MFYADKIILFYLKSISFAGNIYLNKNEKKIILFHSSNDAMLF
jgi:hypothetical protein